MARINNIRLYGMVTNPPTIMKKESTDEYIMGSCSIVVIGKYSTTNSKPPKYSYPRIITRNPDRLKEMESWKVNDIVEIKGSLTTKNMTKVKVCSSCKKRIEYAGTIVYVHPIFSEVRKTGLTEARAIQELKENAEISNSAILMGVLCRDPQKYINRLTRKHLTVYQLAVKRRFRILEDPPENEADFPWVKSYGEQSIRDIEALKKGSVILVDGKLQVRELDVVKACPFCNTENSWKDYAMEVVPHAVEYMRNFRSVEEIEQLRLSSVDKIKADIFDDEKDLNLPASRPDDYVDELDRDSDTTDVKELIDKIFES